MFYDPFVNRGSLGGWGAHTMKKPIILIFITILLLTACFIKIIEQEVFDQERLAWQAQNLQTYQFHYRETGFSPFQGRWQISVFNGKVVQVVSFDSGEIGRFLTLTVDNAPDMPALFDRIQSNLDSPNVSVDFSFHAGFHYPEFASFSRDSENDGFVIDYFSLNVDFAPLPMLSKTEWVLEGMLVDAIPVDVIDNITTLEFSAMDQVQGNAGCNYYFGKVQLTEENLIFDNMAATERACLTPDGIMDQELSYLSALTGEFSYQVTETQLRLVAQSSDTILSFVPEDRNTKPAVNSPVYQDIIDSIGLASCTDNNQCATIAVGHKPCGGPTHYLAYSSQSTDIDVLNSLVTQFNTAQRDENIKLGRISDCMVVAESPVACVQNQCQIRLN